jgi:WD40 repeat protein
MREPRDAYELDVAFSGDGRHFATKGWDDSDINIWDVRTRHLATTIRQPRGSLGKYVFDLSAPHLVTVDGEELLAWDYTTAKQINRLSVGFPIADFAYSSDGKQLAIVGDGQGVVRDTASGQQVPLDISRPGTQVMFSPRGTYLASTGGDVWRSKDGKRLQAAPDDNRKYVYGFSTDEKYLIASIDGEALAVYAIENGRELFRAVVGERALGVAIGSASNHFAVANATGIRIWNWSLGREVARIPFAAGHVLFGRNDELIAAAGHDDTVRVWQWRPSDLVAELCARLPRGFNQAEWPRYFFDEPFKHQCEFGGASPATR